MTKNKMLETISSLGEMPNSKKFKSRVIDLYTTLLKQLNKEFVRYVIVGILTLLIDTLILIINVEVFNINLTISPIISFIIATAFSYIASSRYVFKSSSSSSKFRVFIMFIAMTIVGSIITGYVFALLESRNTHYLFSKGVSIILIVFINYFLRKYIVFSDKLFFLSNHDQRQSNFSKE